MEQRTRRRTHRLRVIQIHRTLSRNHQVSTGRISHAKNSARITRILHTRQHSNQLRVQRALTPQQRERRIHHKGNRNNTLRAHRISHRLQHLIGHHTHKDAAALLRGGSAVHLLQQLGNILMTVKSRLRNVNSIQNRLLQMRLQRLTHSLRAFHQELALLRASSAGTQLRNIAHTICLRIGHHNGGTNTFKKVHS